MSNILLVVGPPKVGKSSLINCLTYGAFHKEFYPYEMDYQVKLAKVQQHKVYQVQSIDWDGKPFGLVEFFAAVADLVFIVIDICGCFDQIYQIQALYFRLIVLNKQLLQQIIMVDPSSLVLFGQDFENGQIEFALIKPHLGNKGLRVIKVQDEVSYTLMNVTNWISDHQLAIWLNNNDEHSVPMIQIIDERLYYDADNNTYRDGEIPWKTEKVLVQFQADPPQTLIDVIVFPYGSQYSVIQRLVGVEPYISLIDWKNHRLVHEFQLGDWNYVTPQNRDYIIHYDDNQDEKSGSTKIKITSQFDVRLYVLKIMESLNIVEKYGLDSLLEINAFYL